MTTRERLTEYAIVVLLIVLIASLPLNQAHQKVPAGADHAQLSLPLVLPERTTGVGASDREAGEAEIANENRWRWAAGVHDGKLSETHVQRTPAACSVMRIGTRAKANSAPPKALPDTRPIGTQGKRGIEATDKPHAGWHHSELCPSGSGAVEKISRAANPFGVAPEAPSAKSIEVGSIPYEGANTLMTLSRDAPRGTKEGCDAEGQAIREQHEDGDSDWSGVQRSLAPCAPATDRSTPASRSSGGHGDQFYSRIDGSREIDSPFQQTAGSLESQQAVAAAEKAFSIAAQSTGLVCLTVPYDLPGKLSTTDTSVVFSHQPVGAPKPLVSPPIRFNSKGRAEWSTWIPYDETGGPIGYIWTAMGQPSGKMETWRIKCATKPATTNTHATSAVASSASKRAASATIAIGTSTVMTFESTTTNLRDLAIQKANGEIWDKSRINPTAVNTPAPAGPATAVGASNIGTRSASPALTVGTANATPLAPITAGPIDCRASLGAPSPSDNSPAAATWRASIAEADANCALANRWRAAILAGPQPDWIKAMYDEALRNHGDVVRGWLADVRNTGVSSQDWFVSQNVRGDPNLSPLMWLCANNIPSPLWPEQYKAEADRPVIAGTTHYQLYEVIIEYNNHRGSDAVVIPVHDDGCQHCTFRFVAGCEPMWYGPVIREWHGTLPGRIEPGPRGVQ